MQERAQDREHHGHPQRLHRRQRSPPPARMQRGMRHYTHCHPGHISGHSVLAPAFGRSRPAVATRESRARHAVRMCGSTRLRIRPTGLSLLGNKRYTNKGTIRGLRPPAQKRQSIEGRHALIRAFMDINRTRRRTSCGVKCKTAPKGLLPGLNAAICKRPLAATKAASQPASSENRYTAFDCNSPEQPEFASQDELAPKRRRR